MRRTRKGPAAAAAGLVATAAAAAMFAAPLAAAANVAQADQGAAAAGIHVSGTKIVEGDGSPLVLRGVSHAHTWYASQTRAFADIDAAGANAVRVVLSDGTRWTRNGAADVANVITLCTSAKLICMLEDHDTTGYGEQSGASTLDTAANYWISLASVLQGTEDRVLINIGNEPYGNQQATYSKWAADTSAAIKKLRAAGLNHTIVVDAPNWGQDWSFTMRDSAATVAAADPTGNTVFSIHMYGVFDTAAEVTAYLDAFTSKGLPIIVGEFGHDHSDGNPDEATIMSYTRAKGIGWFAWSWSGNGGGVEYLDMVTSFNPAQRTTWGNRVITGADGLSQTSVKAKVFGGGSTPSPSVTPTTSPSPSPSPSTPTASPTSPSPSPTPHGLCSAAFRVTNSWGNGFQGEVTVTAATQLSRWTTSFTLPAGVTIQNLWNGTLTTSGSTATVTNAAWNGSVAANGKVTYGLVANGPAPATLPVTCR